MIIESAVLCGCVWETNLRTGKSVLIPCLMHMERMLDDTPPDEDA